MKQEKKKVLYILTKGEKEEGEKYFYMKCGLLDMIEMAEKAKVNFWEKIAKKAGKEPRDIRINQKTGKVTER